jgi:hypothetical protein
MTSPRYSATRGPWRFFVPTALSVLLHVYLLAQAAPALPRPPAEVTPVDLFLGPAAERPAPPALSNPAIEEPAGLAATVTGSEARSGSRRARSRSKAADHAPPELRVPAPAPEPDLNDRPPRPAALPAAELEIVAAPARGSPVASPEPGSTAEQAAGDSRKAIAPLYHQPPGAERSGAMPQPAGAGVGASFDFWAPPVFEEELARATETIGRAEAEHQREVTTDYGHGVICNAAQGWFVCAHDDIDRCNRQHDGNCRYAKPKERYQLEIDHMF